MCSRTVADVPTIGSGSRRANVGYLPVSISPSPKFMLNVLPPLSAFGSMRNTYAPPTAMDAPSAANCATSDSSLTSTMCMPLLSMSFL